ncbi:amidohydrolase family protein [Natronococcus sp. A-GB7]|uniref:dihydroorotase n=1 Tax=Natronococcus sp. A-GB7 TaxID=3037649 RepID=UPI00242049A7|nr:amidohydrolase family protein [Natronococcus sp. A-GB7]MDG5820751.1 amidohydrolase family protein [Natronococcus sp. A-GB7]
MVVETVIAGGHLVTATTVRQTSIAIDNGIIVSIGNEEVLPDARRRIDATGQLIIPGVVDPHVHIDEVPGNRAGTYESETAAAALGGVTTVLDFAWQGTDRSIANENSNLYDGIEHKKAKADQAYVDYGLHGVLHRDDPETLAQIDTAVDAGVTSFKLFMSTYDVGVNAGFLDRAFRHIADRNAVAIVHTEEPAVCTAQLDRLREAGKGDAIHYPDSRPDYAEAMGAAAALRLADETGVKYYGVHTSCRKAAEEIERFRRDGSRIRAETCTHYTVLDDSVYEEQGTLPIVAPPIRTDDDREAMFDYLEKGTLSVVSTDHVVYHRAFKEVENWWNSPYGANSVQWSLPLFHQEAVVERGYSYPFLVSVMCTNPAETFGLPQKGTLEPGTDADIVLFDPNESQTVTSSRNASNATFSIYEGREVTGTVTTTLVRGRVIVDDGELVGSAGTGSFVDRDRPQWEKRTTQTATR